MSCIHTNSTKDFYVLPFIIRINKSMDANILGVHWKLKISSISDLKNKLKLTRDLSAHRSKGSMHLLALSLSSIHTHTRVYQKEKKNTHTWNFIGDVKGSNSKL